MGRGHKTAEICSLTDLELKSLKLSSRAALIEGLNRSQSSREIIHPQLFLALVVSSDLGSRWLIAI